MSRAQQVDDHFLPGVSFTLNGETLPARQLAWAMVTSCGCISGLHMMTVDTMNEAAAWKQMSGNAQMIKRDKARGFTIQMVKHSDVDWGDCTHSPKWGFTPPPTPEGYSWATTLRGKSLHLIPMTALSEEDAKAQNTEWVEKYDYTRKVESVCERASEPAPLWTRRWYRIDGKVECSHCVKLAEKQVLL